MLPHSFFSRPGLLEKVANTGDDASHGAELTGLGVLAAPSVVEKAHQLGKLHGVTGSTAGKYLMNHGKTTTEIAGLGILAAPGLAHFGKKLMGPKHPAIQKEGSLPLSAVQMYFFFDELVG